MCTFYLQRLTVYRSAIYLRVQGAAEITPQFDKGVIWVWTGIN